MSQSEKMHQIVGAELKLNNTEKFLYLTIQYALGTIVKYCTAEACAGAVKLNRQKQKLMKSLEPSFMVSSSEEKLRNLLDSNLKFLAIKPSQQKGIYKAVHEALASYLRFEAKTNPKKLIVKFTPENKKAFCKAIQDVGNKIFETKKDAVANLTLPHNKTVTGSFFLKNKIFIDTEQLREVLKHIQVTNGKFLIPNDPHCLFKGEEITQALEIYTEGTIVEVQQDAQASKNHEGASASEATAGEAAASAACAAEVVAIDTSQVDIEQLLEMIGNIFSHGD